MNILDEKWYRCIHCNKVFSRNYVVKRHIKVYSEEKPKSFNFNQCEPSFNRNENLKIHMKIHTGEKPLKCSNVISLLLGMKS